MPRDRREYTARRYRERMDRCIDYLGGQCVKCGAAVELQIDHIDPATKSFTIGSHSNKACQLLCKPHHIEKTVGEMRVEHGTGMYGTKHCKCDLCKAARAKYYREWYAKHGRKK